MGRDIKRAVTEALELPKESVLNIPLITLVGREEITIENYKGIVEYTEDFVRINTGVGIICVDGRKLLLKNILSESITIKGTVFSLCFSN